MPAAIAGDQGGRRRGSKVKKKGVVSSAAVKVKVCAADGDLTDNSVRVSCGLNKETKKERKETG